MYSLGLVLLELLTGRKAFTGTPQEIAVARLARDPDTSTDVPAAWRALLRDMTDRAAPNRPSAAEVRDRLRAMLLSTTTPTAPLVAVPSATAEAPDGSVEAPTTRPALSTPTADGTAVMPAALLPDEAPRQRHRGWPSSLVIVGLLVLIGLAAVAADDDGVEPGVTAVNDRARRLRKHGHHDTAHDGSEPEPSSPANGNEKGNGNGKGKGKGKGNGGDARDD